MTRPRTIALIVAAGQGNRMGGTAKQFMPLAGKPVLAHSYDRLRAHPAIDDVLIVIGEGQQEALRAALCPVRFVIGGATRRESVRAGLEALADDKAPDAVLIHDAARPFVPPSVIERLVAALDDSAGAVPVLPIADTLARDGESLGETVPRDGLVRVQTPQAFRFAAVLDAHRRWPEGEATDDAQMLRRTGDAVTTVPGDPMLEKITYPVDLAAAEARLAQAMTVRTATGYDVHRLVTGEKLWLGGVLIPHDKGLSGHSDADVALHAITDALLGTIAAGDIGSHFPPSDPQWRGADSSMFLRHAAALIAAAGGVIDFVDLTVICERPRIGPFREAIRDRVADLLALGRRQISVKATTTERLGFTGRGEGIAAQAVATVRAP